MILDGTDVILDVDEVYEVIHTNKHFLSRHMTRITEHNEQSQQAMFNP